ncbi:T7SS effector LXG polymorphic toxin [Staphylococcus aureus]
MKYYIIITLNVYFYLKLVDIKGKTADSIKKYVESAHISTISRAINLMDKLEASVKHLKELGEKCDKSSNAKIGLQTLNETKKGVVSKKKEFIDLTSRIAQQFYLKHQNY